MNGYTILLSQLQHLLKFSITRPVTRFEKAMLIISIDVDVGSREVGVLNNGKNDLNISKHLSECFVGEVEEMALPLFLDLFDFIEIPVTFCVRGQLLEVDNSAMSSLTHSAMKHDIGAHGYYHRQFTNLSESEADQELNRIHEKMQRLGILPRSFIFPKNRVHHLALLARHGYKCYRGRGGFQRDSMRIERQGQLFNICPSLNIMKGASSHILRRILDISAARKLPFHVWFHLWNFGNSSEHVKKNINRILIPWLGYARKKVEGGALTFETMISACEKAEKAEETI